MPSIQRRLAAALAAALAATALLVGPVSPAYAHNVLRKATPAQDAELKEAPTSISLEFTQKLNPSSTTITLSDADKQQVATGEPEVSGTKGVVSVEEALPNGVYTVAYRVVSADGHPVRGSYTFTVADPAATADPGPSPEASEPVATPSATASAAPTSVAAASPAAGDSSGGAGTVALLAGAGALLALVAAAVVLLLRRRSAAGR